MKNILNLLVGSFFISAILLSCEKDEHKNYFVGSTAPVLTADKTTTIPLSFSAMNDVGISLEWTNPDYKFTTGGSSQDVGYDIEIDTSGSNFTNPKRQTVSVSKELSKTFLVSEFNDFLLNQLQLVPAVSHDVEIRVTSYLTNKTIALYSNVLKFSVTPYVIPPKVTPPVSGTLYITGSATPGNWMAGGDPELASQKFTQKSPTLYELTTPLIGGGSYTFVPVYGDWGIKYSIKIKNDPNSVNGGDFQQGGEDILAPAASGNYKIQVDFQRGKFTVTKQ